MMMGGRSSYFKRLISNGQYVLTPWAFLLTGIYLGQQQQQQAGDGGDSTTLFLQWLETNVATFLIPTYTAVVLLYLTFAAFRNELVQLLSLFRPKKQVAAVPVVERQIVLPEGLEDEPQPFDLSGAYKLVSNENFEEFLAVQGVPWALRGAASKARPTHRITHHGRSLTIKIEGVIESQTTYIINGPPVETNVRGRIFEDSLSYLDNNQQGIIVQKRAITEEYDVTVERVLSEDKQTINMTSTALFRDGSNPVVSHQVFKRSE